MHLLSASPTALPRPPVPPWTGARSSSRKPLVTAAPRRKRSCRGAQVVGSGGSGDGGGDEASVRCGGGTSDGVGRRTLLAGTAGFAGAGLISLQDLRATQHLGEGRGWSSCRCGGCAWAMAPLVDVPADKRVAFDPQRNAQQDRMFAKGMNSGMAGYEQAVHARKTALFTQLCAQLPAGASEVTVVEVGMGTFPNAPYYFGGGSGGSGSGSDGGGRGRSRVYARGQGLAQRRRRERLRRLSSRRRVLTYPAIFTLSPITSGVTLVTSPTT
mmetsp:Transcript_31745/g.79762  ORF Transcript_31745/g.79762 Transcript_31745/m.79762 type:complete len:270 (-) Transcript_31745:708-1517(-)